MKTSARRGGARQIKKKKFQRDKRQSGYYVRLFEGWFLSSSVDRSGRGNKTTRGGPGENEGGGSHNVNGGGWGVGGAGGGRGGGGVFRK